MGPHTHTQQPITTGSSVIALKYKDGIMVACDTMVAYGSSLRFPDNTRIHSVANNTLVGAMGEFSDFQQIKKDLDELEYDNLNLKADGITLSPKQVASWLGRVMYNRRTKMNPLWNQLVVGGVKDGKSTLAYVDLQGTYYEEDYMATGFGMHLAMPLLRTYWKADMSEEEAKALCQSCLKLLFYRDCKASCKIQYAMATKEGTKIEEPFKMDTFWEHATWTKSAAELNLGGGSTW